MRFTRYLSILVSILLLKSTMVMANPVVTGNTAFAFELYSSLEKKGNLFISPYSISTALAMTYAGAKGNTAQQMSKVLHFSTQHKSFHPSFGVLQEEIQNDISMELTNTLWTQENMLLQKQFTQILQTSYHTQPYTVDFKEHTEKARKKINQHVSNHTHQKITELIEPGILNNLTRLILVNAIYFKGHWIAAFNAKRTVSRPFRMNEETQFEVPMMRQEHYFNYMENNTLQILEMPYDSDDSVSMIILLPKEYNGLAKLETILNAPTFENWLSQMQRRKVTVVLPKFKMKTSLELSETLSGIGMPDAFTANRADFSGINGRKNLYLSSVIHQAFVEVNETGTEAAAATAVHITTRSIAPRTRLFHADHPFTFLIRHKSGSILFMGRVTNPTQ